MQYRKKPVIVEAIQWDGTHKSTREILEFMGQTVNNDVHTTLKFDEYVSLCTDKGMYIDTLEGGHMASVGDYIIRGAHGEFYPCKPDIFAKTYDPVN
ncbi:hypothetical protein DSECCO2_598600 [anaerobic digester metagenome]